MVAVALVIGAGVTAGFVATANAGLASGSQVSNGIVVLNPDPNTGDSVTTGIPFSSGQTVEVQAPSGPFAPGTNVVLVECEAPNGVLPTKTSECDPGNTQSADTILANSSGGFSFDDYPIWALPDTGGQLGPSTITCGDTAATECVVGMFTDYNSFTDPTLFSQTFGVAPSPSDDGADPGDGSLASAATTPSATLSTVTTSSPTAVADGVDSATVTVTVNGVNGSHNTVPISGQTVTLAGNSGTSSVITPPSAMTNTTGVATFTVTDATAQAVTYTATAGSTVLTPTTPPVVTFDPPSVSPGNSTVSASSPSEPADGTSASTITVTVRDQASDPQPLQGVSVTLAQGTGTSSTITPDTAETTNVQGQVTFAVTDGTAEPVVYTATAGGQKLTTTAPVTFGTLVVSPTQSTVVATTTSAPIGSGGGTTITVTLLTATDKPVSGREVALAPTGTTNTGMVSSPSPQTTDAQGQAAFTVTDANVESVTFAAADSTDSLSIGTATVQFVQASAPTVSPTLSSVTFSPATAPADGTTAINVFVNLKNSANQVVAGDIVGVTLASSSSPGTPDVKATATSDSPAGSSSPGETNSTGTAEFQIRDTVAESVILTITDTTASVVLADSPTVVFTAGTPDGVQSTVAAAPTSVAANGTTSSTVTVTLKDHFGNPVEGDDITLDQSGKSVISAASVTTNASGVAAFTVTDTTNEYVTYQALDTSDFDLAISQTVTVAFGTPPPILPVAGDCAIVTSASSVPADGVTTASITVFLYDGSGNPIVGRTVTLTASGGSSSITPATQVTGQAGTATFAVSDSHAEAVTYSAADSSDNIAVPGAASVTFTPAAAAAASGPPLNHPVVGLAATSDNGGYWMVAADGGVFTFGDAPFEGSLGGTQLNSPIVGMAPTPDGGGYWLVASDGGVFTFGDAVFHGSLGATHLNRPIVGMAATPDGNGYWLVASDGGVFTFGSANFYGALGSMHLNSPIVGVAATPDGNGYWLVASDGGVFTFGDATFGGSMGDVALNAPVVGMAATHDGGGYWIVASDGGVFTFGDAGFHGSAGGIRLNKPIVGIAPTTDGSGYWLAGSDGGIFTNGTRFFGSAV